MLLSVGEAQFQGLDVGFSQFGIFAELRAQGIDQDLQFHIEQRGHCPDIDDVFQQGPHLRIVKGLVAEQGHGDADDRDIVALESLRQGLRGIVHKIAAGNEAVVILAQGLAVHRHHHVDIAPPAQIALFVDPHLVPGRQPLDIGGEDVLWADRHAHAEHRFGKEVIGAGRAGAVDVGKTDDKIVDAFQSLHGCPACAEL